MRRDQIPPPELLKAMNATLQAREILEMFHRLGIDDEFKLARYERHLRMREQAERRILETLGKASGSATQRASTTVSPHRGGDTRRTVGDGEHDDSDHPVN